MTPAATSTAGGVRLTFLGAIDTVTGSRYLVETEDARVLVDCGLFQGPKKLRERNWKPLPFEAGSLDAVIVTHAHIDHTGYLPRLRLAGYTGPVYATRGTRDLLQLLLPDAGHLQEEQARHANEKGYSRHHPALPLYTRDDAVRCLEALTPVEYHAPFRPALGISATFGRAGHIIGSAWLTLDVRGTRLTFSGDVGRPVDPIMRAPEPIGATDYLVVESTYGDRRHAAGDPSAELARVLRATIERGGVVVVPTFAVGRAQHLLFLLEQLRAQGQIPPCPIHLDSPMAIDATALFCDHGADHTLSHGACAAMCRVARYAQTPEDSIAIDRADGPQIILAASGMCTGGRVLYHLRRFLPDERSTILFVGFQAAGTRGRALLDGATELKLLGQYVPVRAKVVGLDGLSAHADYTEILSWLAAAATSPRRVFVTHGEPAAADALRRRLADRFAWDVCVPDAGATVTLDPPR